jgi:hypothetical protein
MLDGEVRTSRFVLANPRRTSSGESSSILNNKRAKISAKKFRQQHFLDRFTLLPNRIVLQTATVPFRVSFVFSHRVAPRRRQTRLPFPPLPCAASQPPTPLISPTIDAINSISSLHCWPRISRQSWSTEPKTLTRSPATTAGPGSRASPWSAEPKSEDFGGTKR